MKNKKMDVNLRIGCIFATALLAISVAEAICKLVGQSGEDWFGILVSALVAISTLFIVRHEYLEDMAELEELEAELEEIDDDLEDEE